MLLRESLERTSVEYKTFISPTQCFHLLEGRVFNALLMLLHALSEAEAEFKMQINQLSLQRD